MSAAELQCHLPRELRASCGGSGLSPQGGGSFYAIVGNGGHTILDGQLFTTSAILLKASRSSPTNSVRSGQDHPVAELSSVLLLGTGLLGFTGILRQGTKEQYDRGLNSGLPCSELITAC